MKGEGRCTATQDAHITTAVQGAHITNATQDAHTVTAVRDAHNNANTLTTSLYAMAKMHMTYLLRRPVPHQDTVPRLEQVKAHLHAHDPHPQVAIASVDEAHGETRHMMLKSWSHWK